MQADNLDIIVVGASGDLARRKIFPALFALFCRGFLPSSFRVFGFARTRFSDREFRARIAERLTCRYTPAESCADKMDEFLNRCSYTTGRYDSTESFLALHAATRTPPNRNEGNRMFYLAVPPSVCASAAGALGGAWPAIRGNGKPWNRVVIEKPFGRDRGSSDVLDGQLAGIFSEDQIYRIDHYLGKEVVQNLMVLRFANLILEPVWNRSYIEKVRIDWREDIGVEDRGGYFDDHGIIRDVVQNHLVQILALVAMERPASSSAKHVQDAKVNVLRRIQPLRIEDVVLGQYGAGVRAGVSHPAYAEEKNVAPGSRTPTCCAVRLRIDNDRWRGVPFIITAGKGLDRLVSEVTLQFRALPENIFCDTPRCLPPNRFVIRIQPDAALYLTTMNKEPGLRMALVESKLDLRYASAFAAQIPDAYECLLLDVIEGDKSLFIRSDELAAAWDIFTPVLREIDENSIRPLPYPFGASGPATDGKCFEKASVPK